MLDAIFFENVLRKVSSFFYNECRNNQTENGIKAYNKIKHGLLIVPNSSIYSNHDQDHPGVLIEVKINNGLKPSIYTIDSKDSKLESKLKSIEFIQNNLKLISTLYLIKEHSGFLTSLGFQSPTEVFRQKFFDLEMQFYEDVTKL